MGKPTVQQVWWRNPDNFIREVVEVGHLYVAWDRGLINKKKIDPVKHANNYFVGRPWQCLVVGDTEQGAAEYLPGSVYGEPSAVYPCVSLRDDGLDILEKLAANPPGDRADLCEDDSIPLDERPVLGQEHRVVVIDIPGQDTGRGRATLRKVADIQADYPDCIIHLHGLYSWNGMFGLDIKSVDCDPRTDAQKGRITLPPGKDIKYEGAPLMVNWVKLLNFMPVDLQIPRNRCMFNMKSALWASEYFTDSVKVRFRRDPNRDIDTYTSDEEWEPPEVTKRTPRAPVARKGTSTAVLPTDKITCNTCSLTKSCRSYREGSICTVTREGIGLAALLGSRDSDRILEGLAELQKKQGERLERALQEEEDFGELSPEVTKMLNAAFANGIKYAKILDPARFAAPKVNVNVGAGGQAAIGVSSERMSPAEISKQIVRELEEIGFTRAEITPKVVKEYLARHYGDDKGRALPPVPARDSGTIEGEVG